MGNEVDYKKVLMYALDLLDSNKKINNQELLGHIKQIMLNPKFNPPSAWVKLADKIPTVEEVEDREFLCYCPSSKSSFLMDLKDIICYSSQKSIKKSNFLWKKIELPEDK